MAVYTSDNLISAIERRSFAPADQNAFTTAEVLALADESLLSVILPNIIKVREEYYVFNKTHTITANVSAYEIPSRAIGAILRDVQIVDDNGRIRDVPRIEPENQVSTQTGSLMGYFIRDNKVILHQTPSSTTGTLRLPFFIQPGNLVLAAAGAVITAINTTTKVITVGSIPSTWITGNSFDLISCKGSHSYRDIDLVSTLVSGSNITLPSLPDDLVVGDYVNLAEESSLVQVPSPYRAVLAQDVAAEMIGAMNQPNADRAKAKALGLMQSAQGLITPRVRGSVRIVTPDLWF